MSNVTFISRCLWALGPFCVNVNLGLEPIWHCFVVRHFLCFPLCEYLILSNFNFIFSLILFCLCLYFFYFRFYFYSFWSTYHVGPCPFGLILLKPKTLFFTNLAHFKLAQHITLDPSLSHRWAQRLLKARTNRPPPINPSLTSPLASYHPYTYTKPPLHRRITLAPVRYQSPVVTPATIHLISPNCTHHN